MIRVCTNIELCVHNHIVYLLNKHYDVFVNNTFVKLDSSLFIIIKLYAKDLCIEIILAIIMGVFMIFVPSMPRPNADNNPKDQRNRDVKNKQVNIYIYFYFYVLRLHLLLYWQNVEPKNLNGKNVDINIKIFLLNSKWMWSLWTNDINPRNPVTRQSPRTVKFVWELTCVITNLLFKNTVTRALFWWQRV